MPLLHYLHRYHQTQFNMLARVISSFVPLLLNLGVSAAPRDLRQSPITKSILPPGPAIIDLSPRITGNSTIFISTSLNPDEVTNVYDSDGKVIYMAVPSSVATEKFLVIENVRSPFALKMVKAVSHRIFFHGLQLLNLITGVRFIRIFV